MFTRNKENKNTRKVEKTRLRSKGIFLTILGVNFSTKRFRNVEIFLFLLTF